MHVRDSETTAETTTHQSQQHHEYRDFGILLLGNVEVERDDTEWSTNVNEVSVERPAEEIRNCCHEKR